jgi:hypothetical protein
VAIVVLFSVLGGFVVGLAGTDSQRTVIALGISNILFGIVAFTIVGCLTPSHRFKHLAVVAAVAWLLSVLNVLFFGVPVVAWLSSIVVAVVVTAIGGGISLFLVKPQS